MYTPEAQVGPESVDLEVTESTIKKISQDKHQKSVTKDAILADSFRVLDSRTLAFVQVIEPSIRSYR